MFEDRRARDVFIASLSFATISMFVYYFMTQGTSLVKADKIPEILKAVDFWYYPVMTFFVLASFFWLARLSGFQSIKYFVAFWCMHWLFYDSLWFFMEVGFGRITLAKLLQQAWHVPVLVRDPTMAHFFAAASLGGLFGLATLTAKRWWHLCPGVIWILMAYMLASALKTGLNVKDDRIFWLADGLIGLPATILAIAAVIQSRRMPSGQPGAGGTETAALKSGTVALVCGLLLIFPALFFAPNPGVLLCLGILMGIPVGIIGTTSIKQGDYAILIPLTMIILFMLALVVGHGKYW